MTRNQFFGDGNKRTALLMMNETLFRMDYAPITITKSREVEYRTALIGYYEAQSNIAFNSRFPKTRTTNHAETLG